MSFKGFTISFFLISFFYSKVSSFAAFGRADSLFVGSTTLSYDKSEKQGELVEDTVPEMYQMHVQSNISNRFAHTTITCKVKNLANKAQETTFSVNLPETAFISGFVMEVDGKSYTAYVKEKEEAKRDYDQAVASGVGAAHIATNVRDSNRFTVSVNIQAETKAAFYLSYEELLKRQDGYYEQAINLHPGQPVKNLSVEVSIAESRKITDLKAPPLRSGNEIGNEIAELLDPRADLKQVNDNAAVVRFTPNIERQKRFARLLNTKEEEGLSGQFIVQYDVERDPLGGDVLVHDGYFVHFFSPTNLDPLPKHVVFVLDTSYSMHGQKIVQLREAMLKILDQLHAEDLFNLVEFNTNAKVWDIDNPGSSVWYPRSLDGFIWDSSPQDTNFEDFAFPKAYLANAVNIQKAKSTAFGLSPTGGTDIYSGLKVALHLVDLAKCKTNNDINRQPIIVFLTDGDPTIRLTSREAIINKITEFNSGSRKAAIFALSFGYGADKDFLKKLALKNSGYNKHIYEGADASLQLQEFYKQISSPLVADVTFKYKPSVTSLTKVQFPIHFGGTELAISGRFETSEIETPVVRGFGAHGKLFLKPTVQPSVANIDRLWAYLIIKQLLEKSEVTDKNKDELKKSALDLALQYSFVTPVTSLVVVKPNDTEAVKEFSASAEDPPPFLPPVQYTSPPPASFGGGTTTVSASPGFAFASATILPPAPRPPPPAPRPPFSGVAAAAYVPPRPLNLLTVFPWFKNILDENGNVTLPSGSYKLGLNETISDVVACLKTPLNSVGHCKLFNFCPQVHSLLINSDAFIQHSCVLKNEFAGICCPDHVPPRRLNLLTVFPWFKSILGKNGNVTLPSGSYKLGLNETISDVVACLKTPLNSVGHCKLLNFCPQVHSLLINSDAFIQHSCVLKNEFAGICCPDHVPPRRLNLLTVFPWFKSILGENGNVTLPSGSYKLGLNETISDLVACLKTPLNSVGHCTLLHSCPQVHSLLINSDAFVQHSCVLKNEFAGICCPDRVPS